MLCRALQTQWRSPPLRSLPALSPCSAHLRSSRLSVSRVGLIHSHLRTFATKQTSRDVSSSAPAATKANASSPEQKNAKNVKTAAANDPLMRNGISNKEQRKADWAIMKEMAQYLWPKVRAENQDHSRTFLFLFFYLLMANCAHRVICLPKFAFHWLLRC